MNRDQKAAVIEEVAAQIEGADAIFAVDYRGMSVPEDLSIVGFDDGPVAGRMRPALTTVRQDVVAKGRAAAAALTAEIRRFRDGGPAGPVPHLLLPTELVVRESSGPAPQTPV